MVKEWQKHVAGQDTETRVAVKVTLARGSSVKRDPVKSSDLHARARTGSGSVAAVPTSNAPSPDSTTFGSDYN